MYYLEFYKRAGKTRTVKFRCKITYCTQYESVTVDKCDEARQIN